MHTSTATTNGATTMTTTPATPTITSAPVRRTKVAPMQSLVNPAWTANLAKEDRDGWYAEIAAEGFALQVSRMDGEAGWTIDSARRGDCSMPMWANGYGARYLLTKTLAAPLAAILDAAIASR